MRIEKASNIPLQRNDFPGLERWLENFFKKISNFLLPNGLLFASTVEAGKNSLVPASLILRIRRKRFWNRQ